SGPGCRACAAAARAAEQMRAGVRRQTLQNLNDSSCCVYGTATMTVHVENHSRQQSKWLALTVLALAQFMVVLDVTIVNVALPSIQDALGFSADGLQWVVSAYTLTFGGLLMLGGRMSDLLGRR